MCDNSTEQDIQRFTEQGGKVNRRQFNQLLATDKPDSPHHTIVESDALALHAIAENDNERSPQMQPMLKDSEDTQSNFLSNRIRDSPTPSVKQIRIRWI